MYVSVLEFDKKKFSVTKALAFAQENDFACERLVETQTTIELHQNSQSNGPAYEINLDSGVKGFVRKADQSLISKISVGSVHVDKPLGEEDGTYLGEVKKLIKRLVAKGGPGSGVEEENTAEIGMPHTPYFSIGKRKPILEKMPYKEENIPMDKITHAGQEKFVPDKMVTMIEKFDSVKDSPIDVLKCGDEYHIIDGHHRYLAHESMKSEKIPARVRTLTAVQKERKTLAHRLMALVEKDWVTVNGTHVDFDKGKGPINQIKGKRKDAPLAHGGAAHGKHNGKSNSHGRSSEHGSSFDPYALAAETANKSLSKIVKADAVKQIVYGIVLEPDFIDAQNEWMTSQDIERTAHLYLQKSRVVGKNHMDLVKADVVESYIAPCDFNMGSQFVKMGSWVIAVKILDPIEWEKVVDGEYTGFSIGGFGLRV